MQLELNADQLGNIHSALQELEGNLHEELRKGIHCRDMSQDQLKDFLTEVNETLKYIEPLRQKAWVEAMKEKDRKSGIIWKSKEEN